MPLLEHTATYPHPRAEVWAWHTRPGAFVRLTPPGFAVVTSGPTNGIQDGSELTLRLTHPLLASLGMPRLPGPFGGGPIGIPWRVRHGGYADGERFVDEQVSGPFKHWRHEHIFSDGPDGSTLITDRLAWQLPSHLPGIPRLIEPRLRGLFEFREQQLRDDLALHARLAADPSHVAITGASGLIGRQLCAVLTTGGHRVTRLVRRPAKSRDEAQWDPTSHQLDPAVLQDVDAVVNLGGETIGGRFTPDKKRAILDSRLESTSTIVKALAAGAGPRTLVQASAIGYYGARRPGELLREETIPGHGFLAEVVKAWEAAAQPAVDAGIRTVLLRTGIVLSEGGGALMPLVPLFEVGAGGPITRRDAWFSWISLDDVARAYVHALLTDSLSGPVNAVSEQPVTARQFATTLGRTLHRPSLIPTPGIGPTLVLGPEGKDQMIDTDQRVSASKLAASGFRFGQPDLTLALNHALARG